jgi:serine/threonine-protein kinase Chk1
MPLDGDGDVHMLTAPQTMSQFTASLMLFSQTQSGRRYNPHLTRFYAAPASADIYALVRTALVALKVQTRVQPAAPDGAPAWENGQLKLRVGGKDARQEAFRGWIVVEPARWNNTDIACVIFQRDQVRPLSCLHESTLRRRQGNPISWRQLWKATTQHPTIWPHVLHRGRTMPNRTVTQEEPTPYADTTVTLSKPPVPPLDITQKELELHPSWPHMN